MVRFRTKSGTIYELTDIQQLNDGEFLAGLRRLGNKPFIDLSGGRIDMNDGDIALVSYFQEPTVGVSFRYFHDRWAGCISTPVEEILEAE